MSKSATAGTRERRNFFCAASARSELSEKFAVIFDHGCIDRDQYRRVGEL
jgi:hypothetical protein